MFARLFVLLSLGLLCWNGCRPAPYHALPRHLGVPEATCNLTDETVTVAAEEYTFAFNRGKRLAHINNVAYYLNHFVGMRAVNRQDVDLLRAALIDYQPLARPLVVMLDAGHGGTDSGCRSGETWESNITLAITQGVATRLRAAGHQVLMTRETAEQTVTLDARTQLAAAHPLDAFVSIHVNATANPATKGVEVYTLPAEGCDGTSNAPARGFLVGRAHLPTATRLAFMIQRRLLGITPTPEDRGVRHAHFKVLRDTPAPSVLVETGFLTNTEEYAYLISPAGQEQLAEAIAQGIVEALYEP